jgi:amino acid transporter
MQSRNMREHLQRVLRTPEVLFIGIIGVVGGGIFLLPGQVAQSAGAAAVGAYLAAGFVVVLIGLSFAEVSTMYDRTGGPLVYAEEAMGKTAGSRSGGWCDSLARPRPARRLAWGSKMRRYPFSEIELPAWQVFYSLAGWCG